MTAIFLILQSKVIAITLFVCLSVCLFVCLFSVCPESIYIHTTQHMEYYTEHYDVIS